MMNFNDVRNDAAQGSRTSGNGLPNAPKTQNTTARRQIMIFAMGAMTLITLATTVIVGAHYWEMLSGIFLIALIGLTLPDWAAWWASYWHAKATKDGNEDKRVAMTCLIVSAMMSLIMILNAGAVLAVWWDDKKSVEAEGRATKASTDLLTAKNSGNTDAIKARGQVVQQMKAAGATERTIREYLKSEAKRDETKALVNGEEKEAATSAAYVSQVPDTVRKYMAFWVYIVPFIAGLFGVFAIIVAVQLPGGVEFGGNEPSTTHAVTANPIGLAPPVTAKSNTTVNGGGNFMPPRQ